MARSRALSIPRPSKKIDNVVWEYSSGFTGSLGAGNQALNFSSVGTSPTTLLRIRGEVCCYLDGATAPPTGIHVTYGIILVPEGSGTTVQYTPVADANAPWLLYGSGFLGYEEMVTDVIDVPTTTGFRHVIDNKAMRRIRPDVEMQIVFENTTVGGADAFNGSYQLRWLQGF